MFSGRKGVCCLHRDPELTFTFRHLTHPDRILTAPRTPCGPTEAVAFGTYYEETERNIDLDDPVSKCRARGAPLRAVPRGSCHRARGGRCRTGIRTS